MICMNICTNYGCKILQLENYLDVMMLELTNTLCLNLKYQQLPTAEHKFYSILNKHARTYTTLSHKLANSFISNY